MDAYAPKSRRPIAGIFRRTADWAVSACVSLGIHPDTISYASIVAAAGAGACFFYSGRVPALLFAAPLLCLLRLWFNMLDGMVALASGKASRRGEIVNELPDRVSDVLIFAGVAHSGLCCPLFGYWAIIGALLTAYVGVLGQAVAGKREYGGVMSKQWRMVALMAASVAAGVLGWRGLTDEWRGWSVLDGALMLVIAGSVETCVVRLANTLRLLRDRPAAGGPRP
ncbi:MAG: CDP-alcohol phosphatidyltransferase family protein [Planctomycetota bacterium]